MAGIITDTLKLGGVPQGASRHVAMATCFDIELNSQNVGFISQITLGHTRTVTQVRHLNSMDAGIAVDTVMTPDAISLNFSGFYVYSASAAVTIGGTVVGTGPSAGRMSGIVLLTTLDQQQIPFDIVVKHVIGGAKTTDAGTKTIIGVYKNCTIQSMSIPINIGTAGIADTGVINVGYVASGV